MDDVDHVVDGDRPDQPPAAVDDRRGDQILLGEEIGDLLLVHGRRHGDDLAPGQGLHRDRTARPQHAAQRHGADRTVAGIDDEDVVEVVRQAVGFPQIVDRLADGPESRHGHQIALHQPPGAVLGIGQTLFEHRAQGGGNRLHELTLPGLLEGGQEQQRVVGFQPRERSGQMLRVESAGHLPAHRLFELRQDFGRETGGQGIDETRSPVGVELFEKVGGFGEMQPGGAGAGILDPPRLEGLPDRDRGVGVEADRLRGRRPPVVTRHLPPSAPSLGRAPAGGRPRPGPLQAEACPSGWCGREDSNFHGISPTATSTLRVYQFRHDRIVRRPARKARAAPGGISKTAARPQARRRPAPLATFPDGL